MKPVFIISLIAFIIATSCSNDFSFSYCFSLDHNCDSRKSEISKITSQNDLSQIALNDEHYKIRMLAINKLTNQKTLSKIALNDKYYKIRMLALNRLK